MYFKSLSINIKAFIYFGADGRTRTGDPCFTRALLYQLSYIGSIKIKMQKSKIKMFFGAGNGNRTRILGLGSRCNSHYTIPAFANIINFFKDKVNNILSFDNNL